MSDLDTLITTLKAFEQLGVYPNPEEHSEVLSAIDGDACCALITADGGCNTRAMRALEAAGYRVFCAERDSFGWLRGGIHTKLGPVYYG